MSEVATLVLHGIDGSNPLGFLAALGTLRTAAQSTPDATPRLGWTRSGGAWRPLIQSGVAWDQERFVHALHGWLSARQNRPEFDLDAGAKNINVTPDVFRKFAGTAVAAASIRDRTTVDFAAAYGCDSLLDKDGRIANTALRTMSGSGHQHFLKFIRNIIEATSADHIRKALFETWRYDDPVEKLTLRWDPQDDTRYALRWRNPSGDPERKHRGSVLGANRLAIEALPLLPTLPTARGLATVGFRRRRGGEPVWRWPIWEVAVPLSVVRSLLVRSELHDRRGLTPELREAGVAAVFQSTRVRPNDYYRNFAPAVAV